MVCTMGVVLPLSFVAGLAARKPVPVVAAMPAGLAGEARDPGPIAWTKPDLWPGESINTRLRRDAAGGLAEHEVVAISRAFHLQED